MDSTLALTGVLPFILLVSTALTLPTSLFLLWLYRRAVLRNMSRTVGRASIPPVPSDPTTHAHDHSGDAASSRTPDAATSDIAVPGGAAGEATKESDAAASLSPPPAALAITRLAAPASGLRGRWAGTLEPWRLATAYLPAGLAYACIMALAWIGMAGDGFYLVRFLWIATTYLWPLVLTLAVILPAGWPQRLMALAYGGLLVGCGTAGLVRSPDLDAVQLAVFWLIVNGPATVLYLAFQNRRIRAVGPLVLAIMTAGVTGTVVVTSAAGGSDKVLGALVGAGMTVGLGAAELLVLLVLGGFAAFAMLGWPLLRAIGRAYRRKRFSDQSLRLDALWLLFATVQAMGFVFSGLAWVLAGPLAFLAYLAMSRMQFRRLRRSARYDASGPILLLLRVFALGRRSERLFDEVGKRWLPLGSIALIAGPDLVTTTVEPDEFLAFAGGQLARAFVQDGPDLERRVTALDTKPDPDGRHRVNEFFCHADTWQATMRRLAALSDAVLMDLRSFSPSNQGCTFELGALLDGVRLDRVVLVTDDTTDQAFLEETLRGLWSGLAPDSPNRSLSAPVLRIARAGNHPAVVIPALLHSARA